MERSKLEQIISNKNEKLERQVLSEAESIIEQITIQQQTISACQERIVKLREQLQKLEVEQLDNKQILG